MKVLLFLILCFLIQNSFSQTKTETEQWIKSKIEAGGLTGSQEYQVFFEKEYLSIGNKTFFTGFVLKMGYLIDIKCITNFYFKEFDSAIHLVIVTSPSCKIQENNFSQFEIKEVTSFTLILNKSFAENDMINRFTKAMNNLIKFYGGSVVKEAY
jgi:hypothetical protein